MSHKTYRKETNCLNCGAEVTGKFCSNCGQENLDTHENFFHVAGHFVSDIFHYDSKFFSSVVPLFTKPGFLTKEYWEGRRTRYIHPLRLFFFVTIVFVLSSTAFFNRFGNEIISRTIQFNQDSLISRIDDRYLNTLDDSTKIYVGGEYDTLTVAQIKSEKARPGRLLNKVQIGSTTVLKSLKYITFFLLPVYALLFKILYRRKKLFYVDHLIYVMHVQTFMYVVLSVIFLIPLLTSLPLALVRQLAFVSLLLYLGFSLHRLYHQRLWKTVIKSVLATFALFFITVMTVMLLAVFDAILFIP